MTDEEIRENGETIIGNAPMTGSSVRGGVREFDLSRMRTQVHTHQGNPMGVYNGGHTR